MARERGQADLVGIGAAAVAGRAGVGQHDVDVAVALLDEVEKAVERALGKDRVGAAKDKADVLLREQDPVARRAKRQVARQLALAGEVGGDAGAQAADRKDRQSANRWPTGSRRREDIGASARRHALPAGKGRELDRRLFVEMGADELPQPISEARRARRGRPTHPHREIVHRFVDQVVFRPEIVAADLDLAAVDGDELGVRPGEAVGAHGGNADGEPRAWNVAQVRRKGRQQRGGVDAVRRILADDEANRGRPAGRCERVEPCAQGGKKACAGHRLEGGDVDRASCIGDQVVHRQQQGVGMAEADIAPGRPRARRGGPDRAARPAIRAVGVAGAGRQQDIALAVLAGEPIERQVVGAMAPSRRTLDQPVVRQRVAGAEIVGNAGEGAAGVAFGEFAAQLLEQRHRR